MSAAEAYLAVAGYGVRPTVDVPIAIKHTIIETAVLASGHLRTRLLSADEAITLMRKLHLKRAAFSEIEVPS